MNQPKKLRKDAADNRARLIAAAEAVFAERGLDATLDDVARYAGVGVGTAYRHFANKRQLANEALRASIEQLIVDAELALTKQDPWEAFSSFFETIVTRQSQNRGLHHIMLQGGILDEEARQRLIGAVTKLFDHAKQAGAIRADAEATDIGPILVMMRTAIDMSVDPAPELWKRYLLFFLDALRATDRPSIATPALTPRQFDQIIQVAASNFKLPR